MTESGPVSADRALVVGLRWGAIGLAVVTVLAVVLAGWLAGVPGIWGAVLGAGIGGGFLLTTTLVVIIGARLPATTAGLVMLVSWVGKVLVALIVVGVLRNFGFYDRFALFGTVVGVLLVTVGGETIGILRQRVICVTPANSADNDPTPRTGG